MIKNNWCTENVNKFDLYAIFLKNLHIRSQKAIKKQHVIVYGNIFL